MSKSSSLYTEVFIRKSIGIKILAILFLRYTTERARISNFLIRLEVLGKIYETLKGGA